MTDEQKEKVCAHSCLYRIEECLVRGDLKEAKLTIVDLLNSLRELEKLQEKDQQHTKLNAFVTRLQAAGINVDRVAKRYEHSY